MPLSWPAHLSTLSHSSVILLLLAVLCLLITAATALYVTRRHAAASRDRKSRPSQTHGGTAQTDRWLSTAVTWWLGRRRQLPVLREWSDAWLSAVNDTCRQLAAEATSDVTVRFDGQQRVSERCHVTDLSGLTVLSDNSDHLVLECCLHLSDWSLSASVIHRTDTTLQTTPCTVHIHSLHAQIEIRCEETENDVRTRLEFRGDPELQLNIEPSHAHASLERVSLSTLETSVRRAILTSSLSLRSSHQLPAADTADLIQPTYTANCTSENRQVFEFPPRRLLVKVYKANGLHSTSSSAGGGLGSEPYCTLRLNEPPQMYTTSPVKNTANPFFDEQFHFDVDVSSRKLTFEVRDRQKTDGNNFLGQAELVLHDIRHLPEGRHILPLSYGDSATTYGSLTVELMRGEPVVQLTGPGLVSSVDSLLPRQPSYRRPAQLSTSDITLNSAATPSHLTATPTPRDLQSVRSTNSRPASDASTLPPVIPDATPTTKRRSLGSAIRKKLSRAMKPPGRSQSADRATPNKSTPVDNSATQMTQSLHLTPLHTAPETTYRTSAEFQLSPPGVTTSSATTAHTAAAVTEPAKKRSVLRRMFHSTGRSRSAETNRGSALLSSSTERSLNSGPPSPQLA